ncbi:MAG TPA: hypothetical protein VME17_03210 [Bryobacteraceae bacterium]|nr:hypothetical protein [Bryobacteraceae bacterium]
MKKSNPALSCIAALAAGVVLLLPASAAAQSAVSAVEKKAESLAPKGWTVPRTLDGQPDLQGYYTNTSLTPMTRAKGLENQLFYTADQAASVERTNDPSCVYNCRNQDIRTGGAATDLARAYNDAFYDRGSKLAPTLQTSVIVDPPNGRMPSLTAAALKEMAQERADEKEKCADPTRVCPPGYDGKTPNLADKPSDFSLMNRCIKWQTSGPPMMPAIYDSNYHIIQTKDTVMIQIEGGRGVRIIPLDGRPHVPSNIRLWLGDSRGHWEGNTLVVDTTNFNDQGGAAGSERDMHVVERFTRVAPHVLLYEFTVNDPERYTRPYTGIIPMTAIKGPIYEYACNEGNYGMADVLRGARLEEKKRAEKAAHEGSSEVTPEKATHSSSAQ